MSLYHLLVSLVIFIEIKSSRNIKDYSLHSPHHVYFSKNNGWSLTGSAIVSDDRTFLTRDEKSQAGSIWLTQPIEIRNWKISIRFKIHGKGTSLYGDGFAFWYIKESSKAGPVFGNHDFFKGLGILFDTYSNHQDVHHHNHPYVSAQINDGTLHYDHDSDGTHSALAGCSYNFRGEEQVVIISYFGSNSTLKVAFNEDRFDSKLCFEANNVKLPTMYYIGLSAITGDLSDNHEILALNFYDIDDLFNEKYSPLDFINVNPHADSTEPSRPHHNGPPASTKTWRFIKRFALFMFLLILCGIVAFVAYLINEKREKAKRKRFY